MSGARAATKAVVYARVPRIPTSYISWLKQLTGFPENKTAFVLLENTATDEIFRNVAQE